MISAADNDLLTSTGPGTPMGDLFRRYWIPIMCADELPGPDCPPVRIGVLCEKLLAFRDTAGRVGLIDEFCAHRGTSLWFGRVEESGPRCPYHGWKYDVNGQCVELPSAPGLCAEVKLKSYPCIEQGDVIWTYMGLPEHQPPNPAFEFATVPQSQRYVSRRRQECNYLQAMEGGTDSVHLSYLHRGDLRRDPLHTGSRGATFAANTDGVFEVVETDGGMIIGVRRSADPGFYYWRITQWIMPFFTMIPPYGDNALNGHAWVPVDDQTCMAWCMTHHPTRPLSDAELETMRGGGIHVNLIPGTVRPVVNRDNAYMMDRAAQRSGASYSGIKSISMQDAAIQESQGAVQDRTREFLVPTDKAIVLARQRLRAAALGLQKGDQPAGTGAAAQRVRSASLILPEDVYFYPAAADALKLNEGVEHVSV